MSPEMFEALKKWVDKRIQVRIIQAEHPWDTARVRALENDLKDADFDFLLSVGEEVVSLRPEQRPKSEMDVDG